MLNNFKFTPVHVLESPCIPLKQAESRGQRSWRQDPSKDYPPQGILIYYMSVEKIIHC